MSNNSENQRNKAFAFMGMSGGILALVIALVIVFPILCCLVMCFAGAISAPFTDATPIPTESTW